MTMRKTILFGALLALMAVFLSGCLQPQDVIELREAAAEAGQTVEQQLDTLRATQAAMEAQLAELQQQGAEPEEIEHAQTAIDVIAASIGKAEAGKAKVETVLSELNAMYDESGVMRPAGVTAAVSKILPPQYGVPASVILTGLFSFFRNVKTKRALTGVIAGINEAKRERPEFATAIDGAGPILRRTMGRPAALLVDKLRAEL